MYDNRVTAALAVCWRIFDHPCGQRLESLLRNETERLRKLGELRCSDEVASKLQRICFRTIDEKLQHAKEVERQKQKYHKKIHPLLYEKGRSRCLGSRTEASLEPCRLTLWNTVEVQLQESFSAAYPPQTLPQAGGKENPRWARGQIPTFESIDEARTRYPFPWKEAHPDNDTAFINWHLYRYCEKEKLEFTRPRPYKKNDNCLVEQKNKTHVRKLVGHLRYDTKAEQKILCDLYRNELRLYKNFFQPVMKLVSKERVNGKIHKKYDRAKTLYLRVTESPEVSRKDKQKLQSIYESLNPAEMKRTIDKKLDLLYKTYQQKNKSPKVKPNKKQRPHSVRFFIAQPEPVSVR